MGVSHAHHDRARAMVIGVFKQNIQDLLQSRWVRRDRLDVLRDVDAERASLYREQPPPASFALPGQLADIGELPLRPRLGGEEVPDGCVERVYSFECLLDHVGWRAGLAGLSILKKCAQPR